MAKTFLTFLTYQQQLHILEHDKQLAIPDSDYAKKITSSSLANVGKYDFKDCTRLESITLGKNLKSIGDSAFNNNRKLKSVNIKSTKLSKVGKSAFSKIYSKAKFTVPKSKLKKYKKLIKSNGKAPKNVKFIAK